MTVTRTTIHTAVLSLARASQIDSQDFTAAKTSLNRTFNQINCKEDLDVLLMPSKYGFTIYHDIIRMSAKFRSNINSTPDKLKILMSRLNKVFYRCCKSKADRTQRYKQLLTNPACQGKNVTVLSSAVATGDFKTVELIWSNIKLYCTPSEQKEQLINFEKTKNGTLSLFDLAAYSHLSPLERKTYQKNNFKILKFLTEELLYLEPSFGPDFILERFLKCEWLQVNVGPSSVDKTEILNEYLEAYKNEVETRKQPQPHITPLPNPISHPQSHLSMLSSTANRRTQHADNDSQPPSKTVLSKRKTETIKQTEKPSKKQKSNTGKNKRPLSNMELLRREIEAQKQLEQRLKEQAIPTSAFPTSHIGINQFSLFGLSPQHGQSKLSSLAGRSPRN